MNNKIKSTITMEENKMVSIISDDKTESMMKTEGFKTTCYIRDKTIIPKDDDMYYNPVEEKVYIAKNGKYEEMLELKEDEILWAKDYEDVIIPTKKDEDADYDIYAYFKEDYVVIQPHETKMIPTGLRVAMNKKWKLALEERGSTGTKGMGQRAGEVDSGFRGEIKVPITNHNNKPLIIAKYELEPIVSEIAIIYPYSKAICQGAIVEVPKVKSREINVELLKAIPSERGEKMLGSSGK